MESSRKSQTTNLLRVISHRLTATPSHQLPHVVPYLANLVSQCRHKVLAPEISKETGPGSEDALLAHKFKTQLSAFLQSKSPEARYAAVVLVKATIESGGRDILQGAGAWVRSLIGIIGKPDPIGTKQLCIITSAKIFRLAHENQTLVREITTPCLPGFLSTCLKNVSQIQQTPSGHVRPINNELLLVVLQSLAELIALHPPAFRPFLSQIRALCLPLIAPTPSNLIAGDQNLSLSISVSACARRLYALLHVCAPKNTAVDEWARSLDDVINVIHTTTDTAFRALIEDWAGSTAMPLPNQPGLLDAEVADLHANVLGLPKWTGIYAGIERLEGLLHTLQSFISGRTSVPVEVPIGRIANVIDRILSALPPSGSRNPRTRPEIGRDEREGLFSGLPYLHVVAMNLSTLLVSRLGFSAAPLMTTIVEQVTWLFESECHICEVREAAYKLISIVLKCFGPSLPKSCAKSLWKCILRCCEDLCPQNIAQNELSNGNGHAAYGDKLSKGTDLHLAPIKPKAGDSESTTNVQDAASELLLLSLTRLPDDHVPAKIRSHVDRTAILTKNKGILLASTMNPSIRRGADDVESSLMPFLARNFPDAPEVEALIRPQMPVVQRRKSKEDHDGSDDEEEESTDRSKFYQPTFTHDSDNEAREATTEDISNNITPALSKDSVAPNEYTDRLVAGDSSTSFAVSYVSQKRVRDDSPISGNNAAFSGDASLGNMPVIDQEQNSKRVRLAEDTKRDEHPVYNARLKDEAAKSVAQQGQLEVGTQSLGIKGAPPDDQNAKSNLRPDIEQHNSDESDFEIPELHLGFDELDDEDADEESGNEEHE